jgi:hypothetical protein
MYVVLSVVIVVQSITLLSIIVCGAQAGASAILHVGQTNVSNHSSSVQINQLSTATS